MTGRHFNNTENLAAAKRTWRDRYVYRWVVLAGSISLGMLVADGTILGSDKPPARSSSATVQITAAPPISFRSKAAITDRPLQPATSNTPRPSRISGFPATPDRPAATVSEKVRPTVNRESFSARSTTVAGEKAEAATDLTQRAAEFGQRIRERFAATIPSTKLVATEGPDAKELAAKPSEPAAESNLTTIEAAQNTVTVVPSGLTTEQKVADQLLGAVTISNQATSLAPLREPPTLLSESIAVAAPSDPVESSPLAHSDIHSSHTRSWELEIDGTQRICLPGNVASVRVSDQKVCEILQVGSREVVVVGKASGTATVRLSFDSGTPDQLHAFRVSRHADEIAPTEETLAQFQAVLVRKFPRRSIELQWSRESLVVKGTAADRQEAIQILAFVRNTYLVPVVDRLDVPRGKPSGSR